MTSSLFQCGDEAKSSLALPHQFTDVPPGPQAGGQGACDGGRRGDHHTDSDISVTFAEANIVHVRDTYWNGIYPFIDYSTGGIDGMIAASDANLAATTNDTIITPGHGRPVSNKAELKEFRDVLVAIRENVAKLKKQGRSRDETVVAKPTAAFDAKWGQFVIDPGYFTRLVYEGV